MDRLHKDIYHPAGNSKPAGGHPYFCQSYPRFDCTGTQAYRTYYEHNSCSDFDRVNPDWQAVAEFLWSQHLLVQGRWRHPSPDNVDLDDAGNANPEQADA